MTKMFSALLIAFSFSMAVHADSDLVNKITSLEQKFMQQYNSGDVTNGCATAKSLKLAYRLLISGIVESGKANSPEGQHATTDILTQIAKVNSVCPE